MYLKIENGALPKKIKDLIASKQCVVFLGSGVSCELYGSWQDLVNKVCEKTGNSSRVTNNCPPEKYLEAAEAAKTANPKAYFSLLGEHFGQPVKQIPILYATLLGLPFAAYLTSNFDPLLALQASSVGLKCFVYPALDRKNMSQKSAHYIHGLIKEHSTPVDGSIVLSNSDFVNAYKANSALKAFLTGTFENEPMLFIGCQLKEPVLTEVIKIAQERQQERQKLSLLQGSTLRSPPPKFIFFQIPTPKNDMGEIDFELQRETMQNKQEYYTALGIFPVWYDYHEVLRPALDQLNLPYNPLEFDCRGEPSAY